MVRLVGLLIPIRPRMKFIPPGKHLYLNGKILTIEIYRNRESVGISGSGRLIVTG